MKIIKSTNTADKKSQQLGRTMIEMLGVLGIIGVLTVGGLGFYSKAMEKHKFNKLNDQIADMINKIHVAYNNKVNYTGISASSVISYGIIEPQMVGTSGSNKFIKNVYGGKVYVNTGNTADNFWITIDGLPPTVCVNLAVADWGADHLRTQAGNITTIGISGGGNAPITGKTALAIKNCTANNTCTTLPMPIATATTVCTKTSNFVAFMFQ